MNGQRKPEIRRQSRRNLAPASARVGTAINAAVVLLIEHRGFSAAEEQLVNALAEFGVFFGEKFGPRALVGHTPGRPVVLGAKDPDGGNAGEQALRADCCQPQWNGGKGRPRRDASGPGWGVGSNWRPRSSSVRHRRCERGRRARRRHRARPAGRRGPARCARCGPVSCRTARGTSMECGSKSCPGPPNRPVRSRTRSRWPRTRSGRRAGRKRHG